MSWNWHELVILTLQLYTQMKALYIVWMLL